MSWGQIKFGDFITLQRGHDLTKEQFIPGEYPVVSSTTIMGYHNEYKAEAPGVVIGRSGTLGEVQYIDTNFWPHNTSLYVKDFKGNNPRFVYYFLKYFGTESSGGGSAVPTLNRNNLNVLDVNIPNVYLQKKISDILSVYDDLIENNQKQIKLLEEAAQRLYKEWFIDLRFPGYENTPIIDGVPQRWNECAIFDLCEKINAGGTPSRRNKNYWSDATIKWYKTQELQDCWLIDSDEKISVDGQKNSSAKFFPKNTILMAIYASPTLGKLGILDSDATCNQAALCLKADETIISWQWLYEKLYELRDHYNGIARGAGQQNISGEVVKQTIVLCPTKELMDKFTQIVAPWFEKRRVLQKQNISMIEARNRLLPKLMSGELEV